MRSTSSTRYALDGRFPTFHVLHLAEGRLLIGHSITYRVATGPRTGQKVFTLQTLPPREEFPSENRLAPNTSGFSLHAVVSFDGGERTKLE